jgi:hypothetical protein
MAEQSTQNLANHRRFHPPWHFVAIPILAINVVAAAWHAYRHPAPWAYWEVVVAVALFLAVGAARSQTLTVQNRLIRLEMRMRLRELLSPALAARIPELTVSQLIGLRFASDAELPGLVERCLAGELKNNEAVKKEVRAWTGDYLRA